MEYKTSERKIDLDFESRNWLLLVKLYRLGFSPEESKKLARNIELGAIKLRDIQKQKGE